MTSKQSSTGILESMLIGLIAFMVVFGILGAIQIPFEVDRFEFVAKIFSVLVAVLMVYVIGIQAEVMRQQTAILYRQADDMSVQSEVL